MPETVVVSCCAYWWAPFAFFGIMALVCLFMMLRGGCCGPKRKEE